MPVRIGIPRALHYYSFASLWKRFFGELGAEVVVSRQTSKDIIDSGVLTTVTDACAPIKVFQGHVADLVGRVDRIFIPRMVSFEGRFVFCPKFIGLPDMVRATMDNLPEIIDTEVDLRRGPFCLIRTLTELGESLGYDALRSFRAAISTSRHFAKHEDPVVIPTRTPARSLARVAVVGYPYIVHDPYLSCGLIEQLTSMSVDVVTIEQVSQSEMRAQDRALDKQVFWHYSNRVLKASYHLMSQGGIDGIIHVTAFGCGPDAIVDKFLELDSQIQYHLPFLSLTIDEHSGQAGTVTRLEAFVDMIARKRSTMSIGAAGRRAS